jgi:nitrogen fixation NifU-like protein
MVTDMARGKTIQEAMGITNKSVAEQLGGLPKNKLHCSNLGADALHKAIQDYLDRKEGRVRRRKDETVEHLSSHEGHCYCPYCDTELPEQAPYCTQCGKPTLTHED